MLIGSKSPKKQDKDSRLHHSQLLICQNMNYKIESRITYWRGQKTACEFETWKPLCSLVPPNFVPWEIILSAIKALTWSWSDPRLLQSSYPLKSLSNRDDMSTCNGLLHGIVRALADSTLPRKDPSVRTLQTGRRCVPLCINHEPAFIDYNFWLSRLHTVYINIILQCVASLGNQKRKSTKRNRSKSETSPNLRAPWSAHPNYALQ